MCARVTIDQNGNRYTNTRPANEPTNNIISSNPFLALLGMFAGVPRSNGSFNIQTNPRNNTNNQIVFNTGGTRQNSFEQMIMSLLGQMNMAP